jgi:hypothetical protein
MDHMADVHNKRRHIEFATFVTEQMEFLLRVIQNI